MKRPTPGRRAKSGRTVRRRFSASALSGRSTTPGRAPEGPSRRYRSSSMRRAPRAPLRNRR